MEMMAEVVMAESGIAIANKASAQKSIKQKEYNTKWYQKQTSSQINERNKNKKLKMSAKRKHTNDMTKVGTDDVEDKRLKHTNKNVVLSTAVEKVERKSNEDDGLREGEEDMKVVDVDDANEDVGTKLKRWPSL